MAGKEQGQIIDRVVQNRQLEAAHNASVEQARGEIPAFKEKINKLIRRHISKPKTRKIPFQEWSNNVASEMYDNNHGMGKETGTVLKVEIPTSEGSVDISIRSSDYPARTLTSFKNDNISYKIDVSGIDHYLEIDNKGAKLKSKDRNSSMPTDLMRLVRGRTYDSRPAWETDVDKEELDKYSELIDLLLRPNPEIIFKGSTPEITEIKHEKPKKGTILFALDEQAKRFKIAADKK